MNVKDLMMIYGVLMGLADMVELHNSQRRPIRKAFNEKYDSIRIEFTVMKHSFANCSNLKIWKVDSKPSKIIYLDALTSLYFEFFPFLKL